MRTRSRLPSKASPRRQARQLGCTGRSEGPAAARRVRGIQGQRAVLRERQFRLPRCSTRGRVQFLHCPKGGPRRRARRSVRMGSSWPARSAAACGRGLSRRRTIRPPRTLVKRQPNRLRCHPPGGLADRARAVRRWTGEGRAGGHPKHSAWRGRKARRGVEMLGLRVCGLLATGGGAAGKAGFARRMRARVAGGTRDHGPKRESQRIARPAGRRRPVAGGFRSRRAHEHHLLLSNLLADGENRLPPR